MKKVLLLSFVLVFAFASLVYAQPNFSGTWVLDAAKSDMGMKMPAGHAQMHKVVLVLKQTANQLSIERSVNNKKDTAVFKLDGSESINTLPTGDKSRTIMKWAGNTLVAKTTSTVAGMNTEMTDVRSLSANGQVMTLQVTQQMPSRVVKKTLIYNKQ